MDEPTQTVVMHRTEPTHLQALALQLSEKVSSLVDYNERTMETKSGIFFFQKQGKSWFVAFTCRWDCYILLTLIVLNLIFDIMPVPPNILLPTWPLRLNSFLATDTLI